MENLFDIFQGVVEIAKGVIPISACLAILIKPIRERLLGIKAEKDKKEQKNNLNDEIHVCLLRRDMRFIYNTYHKEKIIPERDAIDFFNHYVVYAKIGGNAWVDSAIIEILNDWIVEFVDTKDNTPTIAYFEALNKVKETLKAKGLQ